MPGYANSMGAISFCGRTTVSRDTNSDNTDEKTVKLKPATKKCTTKIKKNKINK